MNEQQNTEQIIRHTADRVVALIESERSSGAGYFEGMREDITAQVINSTTEAQEAMKGEIIGLVRKGIARLGSIADTNAENIAEQMTELRKMAERAEAAAEEARKVTAEAERATAAANAAAERAEAERAAAEKATAILTLKGDIEVERMVKAAEFKAREKATREALKNELAAMEDHYDLLAEQIDSGIHQYYPRMREEMERLAAEEDGDAEEVTE